MTMQGFPIETQLRDGTPVHIRPIEAGDKHLLEVGLQQLSDEDRHFRFFAPISRLSDDMLHNFTDIDHVDAEAIGALDIGQTPGAPIGVARYFRLPGTPAVAEVAVTVTPAYQGRGVGSLLLALLAHRAVSNGITAFTAMVLYDNRRMLEVFGELGARTKRVEGGVVEVDVPLFSDAADYPQTSVGDVFRQTAALMGRGAAC